MRENRMKFAKAQKDWTVSDWNRVLWSDESPFELFQTPNRQNDRVWCKEAGSILAKMPLTKELKMGQFWCAP